MSLTVAAIADRTGGVLGSTSVPTDKLSSWLLYQNLDDPVLRERLPRWEEDLAPGAFVLTLGLARPAGDKTFGVTLFVSPTSISPHSVSWTFVDTNEVVHELADELTPYAAVNFVAATLGVPLGDVLKGASIKRRTYYSWRDHPAVSPRLASQGDLWAVVEACGELEEIVGSKLKRWFQADRRRREALRAGRLDELVAAAYTSRLPEATIQLTPQPSSAVGADVEMEPFATPRVPTRGTKTRSRER